MRWQREITKHGGSGVTPTVQSCRPLAWAVVLALAIPAAARAELNASYDGVLTAKRFSGGSAAAVLSQTGSTVVGTLALTGSGDGVDGIYNLTGTRKGSKLAMLGANAAGTRMKLAARIADEAAFTAVVKLRGGAARGKGSLALTRHVATPPDQPREHCDNSFFTDDVMQKVLVPVCGSCHTNGGIAQNTTFRVTSTDALATQDSVASHIDLQDSTQSRLLLKPLNQIPHGGGPQLAEGSEHYTLLARWAELVATNQQCNAASEQVELVPLAPAELLVRASMDLRGTRPALDELARIESDGTQYGALVDEYLHSAAFLERVKDVFDDALLVRREDFTDERRDETAALYGEATELIAYIVANDRSFKEIGTADYTVASAAFQQTGRMPYPMEPVTGEGWQPTHYLDGRPHAGLFSTSAFYQVWDTNNTNLNRRRANRWSIVFHCYNFLDTPVDVTRNVDNNDPNAVLNAVTLRPDCKACHDRLDPMASFLFPADNAGFEGNDADDFFRGNPERWRRVNRRAPAVYGRPGMDIRDMGRLMVEHEKFDQCQTKRAFRLLTGRWPESTAELRTADEIARAWPSDGHDFRKLVRRWMTSDLYVARPKTHEASWVRRASPERLEALFADVTGFVWTRDPDNDEDDANPESLPNRTAPVPLLTTEERGFRVILGSINGTTVSARSVDLNASVAVVQRKLATLAAEHVMTTDLAAPDGSRTLLNGVRGDESPTADADAIRAVIVQLARRLYGVTWTTTSEETTVLLNLFRALYDDGTQSGTGQNQVPGTAAERAWRGLLVAMLRSSRMLLY